MGFSMSVLWAGQLYRTKYLSSPVFTSTVIQTVFWTLPNSPCTSRDLTGSTGHNRAQRKCTNFLHGTPESISTSRWPYRPTQIIKPCNRNCFHSCLIPTTNWRVYWNTSWSTCWKFYKRYQHIHWVRSWAVQTRNGWYGSTQRRAFPFLKPSCLSFSWAWSTSTSTSCKVFSAGRSSPRSVSRKS